ncbi:hypothetical protein KC19_VG246600 [Ceratodon purpureus]|uniref:Uncharacterized protein n=1 Tax=Ceratodon purpureus TaxID=3225 RepID=A0A8T0HTW7_CERPU|nr:hypothetical protein KC19_VG246600 [Ceratodon purpureus]
MLRMVGHWSRGLLMLLGGVPFWSFDDREVSLLAAWIRRGFWVTKEGRKQIRIHLLQDGDVLGVDWATSSIEHTFSVQLKDGKV